MSQRDIELVKNYRPDLIYFDDNQITTPMTKACNKLFDDSKAQNGSVQTIITAKRPQFRITS